MLENKSCLLFPTKKESKFGLLEGKIRMKEGFDEPLECFKDYTNEIENLRLKKPLEFLS